jgi:hypothetical protein
MQAKNGQRLTGFHILTEYECGRALTSIEWVARSEKPIVEIGGRPMQNCDFRALAHDLNCCILRSGEDVRGFIIPDKMRGYCCYGFFKHSWAVEALLDVWGIKKSGLARTRRLLWMQGLVFGYSPDAIQRFILSACGERASIPSPAPCNGIARYCKVEIYGTPARLFRRHSSLNGKYRKRY